MKAKNIGVIGRINDEGFLCDGQTVKTRTIWRMLKEEYGEASLVAVDTTDYRKNPWKVAFQLARCLVRCEDIVVLLSRNGRNFFFPVLKWSSAFFGKRIYHSLIGGQLAIDTRENQKLADILNSFCVNWVETQNLVDDLKSLGVNNTELLPNFKQITPVTVEQLKVDKGSPVQLCTFSRVVEEKGILQAMQAIERLCEQDGDVWALDIYGPVAPEFQDAFERALKECTHSRYRGVVEPEKSVETLAPYRALLFPTKCPCEGFPGTVLDALSAGLPVIASRWDYYSEMLEDGSTGFSYSIEGDVDDLIAAIRKLPQGDALFSMKHECLRRATSYGADALFRRMTDRIELEGRKARSGGGTAVV